MSQTDSAQVGPGGVDEAMNRVLAAERDARLAVAECRAEASRLVAEGPDFVPLDRLRTLGIAIRYDAANDGLAVSGG